MVFNPNLESGPTPESPVFANVSAQPAGGMSRVAANAIDVLGGFVEQAGERRQAAQTERLRRSFIGELEVVRARVESGDLNGASIAAGRAVSAYVGAGGTMDANTRAAATAITGLPENMFGVSEQGLMAEADRSRRLQLVQNDRFQAYMFLEKSSNPTMSEEELFAAAENRFYRAESRDTILAEARQTGQLNFEAEGRQAIFEKIDDFTQVSIGALVNSIDQGQVVDPRAVDSARIQFSALRREIEATLVNVTSDQRQEVINQFEQVDNIISNISSVLSSAGQTERLSSIVIQLMSAGNLSDYTPEQVMTALLASSDLTSFLTGGMGTDQFWFTNPQNVQDLMQSISLNFTDTVRKQAYENLPITPDGTVDRNGLVTYDSQPQDVRNRVDQMNERNIVSSMNMDAMLLSEVNTQNVTSPEMATRTINRTYELGVYMLSAQGRPFSADVVRQLGLTGQLGESLNILESIGFDDEGEALARVTLRSGLFTQISSQQEYLRTLEQSNPDAGLRWNAQSGEYEVTDTAFIESFAQSISMPVDMMLENGVVRLSADTSRDEGWRRQLRGRIGNVDKAFDYRESLGMLQEAFDSLRAEVPEDQAVTAEGFRLPPEIAQDTAFLNATTRVVSNLQNAGAQITEDDLFRIIEFETGGSWAPDQKAGTSSATGLIQFLESTAQGLGTSTAELAQMTRAEQMEYVQRYLEPYAGRIRNFGDLYMAIHWPAGVGQDDDFVMYREGSREYTANRGLDANGDGIVTRGETMAVVERRVGRGTGAMTSPRTAAGIATLEGPTEELLPPRTAAPVAQTSVRGMAPADQTEAPEVLQVEDPVVETTQPEGVSRPAPDAPPPAEIARSLQEIAQGAQEALGADAEVSGLVTQLVARAQSGENVGYADIYEVLSRALRLPSSPEKRRLVNDLYDLAEQVRGQ